MTLSPPQKVFIGANILAFLFMTTLLIIPKWLEYHYEYSNSFIGSYNVVDAHIAPFLYYLDDGYKAPGVVIHKNATGFIDLTQTMFSDWVRSSTDLAFVAFLLMLANVCLDVELLWPICRCFPCLPRASVWKLLAQAISTFLGGMLCFITVIIMGAKSQSLKYEGHKGKVKIGWALYVYIIPLLAILIIGILQTLDSIKSWRFRGSHGVFKGGEPLTVGIVEPERSRLLEP